MQSEQGIGVRPARYSDDKRPHHIVLEPLFLVHHVIGNAQVLGHAARVVHIVERAAAARLGRIGNAVLARQPRLIPKLQREADNLGALVAMGEDRRHRRGVDSSGHGYGNGVWLWHGDRVQLYFRINCICHAESAGALDPEFRNLEHVRPMGRTCSPRVLVPRFKRLERVVRASTVGIDVNRKVCSGKDLLIVRGEARAGVRRPLPFWLCRR